MNDFQIDLVCPIDEILTGTTTPDQSKPGNNGIKGVFHTLQIRILTI